MGCRNPRGNSTRVFKHKKGRADYALFTKDVSPNSPITFIEVKKFVEINNEVIREKLKYSFDLGVNYTIITDGDALYKAFEPGKTSSDRTVTQRSILRDDPYEIAFKALNIAKKATQETCPSNSRYKFHREPGSTNYCTIT
jgi:predicted type IV restriction endonuclease